MCRFCDPMRGDLTDPTRPEALPLFEVWSELRLIFARNGVPAHVIELARHGFYSGSMATLSLVYAAVGRPDALRRLQALSAEVHGFQYDIRNPSELNPADEPERPQ